MEAPLKIANHEITQQEYRALAYMLEDATAWLQHAAALPNATEAITHKIQQALALVAKVPAAEYTTRAERDAQADAALQPTPEQAALHQELTLARLHADLAAATQAGLYQAAAHLQAQITALTNQLKAKTSPKESPAHREKDGMISPGDGMI